ncbi:MAG: DegQ family serine endoprotease [Ignavibacteriales bacterium]
MKKKNIIGAISLLFFGAIFGAILVSGFGLVKPGYASVGNPNPPIKELDPMVEKFNNAFVEAAEVVTPSIVQINTVSTTENKAHEMFKFFFPFKDDVPEERQGGGSGVIISEDGYILTNNHVVENATHVEVTLHDKREYEAEVIGTDPLTDLAVIKIDAKNLPAASLGNSDNLKVGQWVMAIGNPLSLTSTVTAGIISAIGRNINIIQDSYGIENFIQTDAAINPGNSGGALVDLKGNVIGINSAIATNGFTSNYIGYGFAIPINIAKTVSEDLISNGEVNRGYIGVRIEAVNTEVAKAVGLDKPRGILVQGVVEDGAAASVGIKEGDVILKIDGKDVDEPNSLQSYVASKRAGDVVTLTIFRDKKEIKKEVKLKARTDDENVVAKKDSKTKKTPKSKELSESKIESLGLSVRNVKEKELEPYKVENGVMITKVERFSKAEGQKLGSGVVIVEVDRKQVNNVSEFIDLIESKKGSAVLLKVAYQDGTTRLVGLEVK